MIFALSSYRRLSHFAIASLFLLRIIAWASNFDLSISASFLGALYQVFTCWYNRVFWSMHWPFLDPNNVWRQLYQHALLQFINILRSPGIHFLFSSVLMAAHLIDNLPWKASSHPSCTWEENAFLTCALTVSSSKNGATFCYILDASVLPLQLSPRCDSVLDSTTSIPNSNALRRWSSMRQVRKWAVTCERYSLCVWARDVQPTMGAIVSLLLDWQHLRIGLRSLLYLWA